MRTVTFQYASDTWAINYGPSRTLAKGLLCTTYCSRVWAYKGDVVPTLEEHSWRDGGWTDDASTT